jgi:TctA family transporter
MSITLISFIVSGSVAMLMIILKATVFKDNHIHVWVKVRSISDSYIHRSAIKTKAVGVHATRQGLLKIITLVYHKVIPTIESLYRKIASLLYKFHRKLWSFLEYSKKSTHQVSEYLKHLSEHKK